MFFLYIIECKNNTLYTGITKDLAVRLKQHVSGKGGAKYTRANKPVRLCRYWKIDDTIGTVLRIERLVKKQGRAGKDALIAHPKKLGLLVEKKQGAVVTITCGRKNYAISVGC